MLGRLFRRKKNVLPEPFPGLQPRLCSRFRLESSLGPDLYLARDSIGDPFEIRFLSGSDEAFRRVRREISLTRTLTHPALAPIVDIGGDAKDFWLARRALSDPTLRSLTSAGQTHPVEQVRVWISGMLDGLEALHKAGRLFDNWEDGSVYLGEKGATLANVGFSERRWRQSNHFVHVGDSRTDWTVTLLCPEGTGVGAAEPRSDLYSMASAAFQLLCGQPPLGLESDVIIYVYKVRHVATPSISTLREDLPQGLIQMVDLLLAKTPKARGELDYPRLRRMLYSDRALPAEISTTGDAGVGAFTSIPEMGDLLQAARAEGVDDGVGQFTLNPEQALEKLRRFQFSSPFGYLLPLLACATGLKPRGVKVTTSKKGLVISIDCLSPPPSELQEMFTAAAMRNRRDPITHLGLAVAGALGGAAERVEISSEAGTITLAAIEAPKVKPVGSRSGLEVRIFGKLPDRREVAALAETFRWLPIPLQWDAETLSVGDEARGLHRILGEEGQPSALLTFEDPLEGLFARVDGLSFVLQRKFALPGAAVVLDAPWKLDLSYQGILAEATFDELRDEAEREMIRREIENMRLQPLDRERATHYTALLRHVLQPDLLDELHGRILDATNDLPADYPFPLWRDDDPAETPWEQLVAGSCRHARGRRLPSFAKASRLLTHPRYLTNKDWERAEDLGRDAFTNEGPEFHRFLVAAWASCDNLKPPLARVPEMLRCLTSVGPSPAWDAAVKRRLMELALNHSSQLEELAPLWWKCLPAEFPQSRSWCGRATFEP